MSGALAVLSGGGQAFSATAAPPTRNGFTFDPSPAITGACNVSTSLGVPGYTYLWSQTGGDSIVITTPTGSSTTFSGAPPSPGTMLSGTFVCTVTDAIGQVAVTNTVVVNLSWS